MLSATASAVSLAWDPSWDKVGVSGYRVHLNRRVVATSTLPWATISGLGCGRAYTFGLDAYDAAGNYSRKAWATVATAACADQQAPTAPTGFRQQAATQNEVVLAWDPSTDNIGVVGYGVYRNGLLQTSTAAPTVTLSRFVCGSVYEVAVDAVDAAGNRSQPRATWVKTAACSDTQPPAKPTLSLGPATATSLALNWQPGVDNVGVDHYNVFLNGVKVAQTTGLIWTYTGLACGTDYALGLEVEDAAGNKSSLTEGTLSPVRTSACSSPPPPPADTTAPSQPGSLGVTAATNTSVAIAWSASTDNVGVAGYGVYVNGANVQSKTQPGATVSGLACGTAYTLAVDAFDLAGNRSTKASVVGTTAPCADTQAPSPPANVAVTSRTATSVALSWSASSDNVGVVGYGLYQGATLTGTTAVTTGILSNLACGSAFTLAVDSYDAAGNRSGRATITASTTACPDTAPPSMPSGLSTSNVTGTSMTLGWNASTDNLGVTGYDVYRNGARMASVTGTSSGQTGLACGTSYAFAVVSYDAAGNRSSQAQLTAPTAACAPPPPPPPPPAETAHLWVDTDGGTCTRSANPVAYDTATACATADQAYDTANLSAEASTVRIRNGNWSTTDFVLTGSRTSSNRITFDTEGGLVEFRDVRLGAPPGTEGQYGKALGPDFVTLRHLRGAVYGGSQNHAPGNRRRITIQFGTTNVTVEESHFGSLFTTGGSDLVIRGSEFGPCWQGQSMTGDPFTQSCGNIKLDGGWCIVNCTTEKPERRPERITFEGNVIHDFQFGPSCFLTSAGGTHSGSPGPPDCHYEAVFLNGGTGLTFRGNVFRDAALYNIFTEDTQLYGYTNVLIENNVFGTPIGYGTPGNYNNAGYTRASGITMGCGGKANRPGLSNVVIRNNSFARNTTAELDTNCPGSPSSGAAFTGNISSKPGCAAGWTFSYNVYNGTGTCGTGDASIGGTAMPFYTVDTQTPTSTSDVLAGPSAAPDNRVPAGLCPPIDLNGNPRTASFCDAGAHER